MNSKIDEQKWESLTRQLVNLVISIYGLEAGLEHLENFGKVEDSNRLKRMIQIYKERLGI